MRVRWFQDNALKLRGIVYTIRILSTALFPRRHDGAPTTPYIPSMKFPPSILDDIKARLPVSAVVGRRVRLVKAGREWKGLSPFGKERTPSFFVNDQKQAWFDFSSGRNGDIFTFVMETEGVSFPEAVERLAAEAGVILPKVSEEAVRQEETRKGLYEVIEMAPPSSRRS